MTGLTCARDPSRGPYALGAGGGHDGASAFEERHEKTPPSWWPGAVTAAEHGAQREASESSRRSGDGTLEAGTPRRRPEPQGGWRGTGGGSGAVETGLGAGRSEGGETGRRGARRPAHVPVPGARDVPQPAPPGAPAVRGPRAPLCRLRSGSLLCGAAKPTANTPPAGGTCRALSAPARPPGGPRRACGIFPRRTQKSRTGNE